MTITDHKARAVLFVSPHLTGESLLAARAVKQLSDIQLFSICEQPPAEDSNEIFEDLIIVDNVFQADQLIAAAHRLKKKYGALERIVTVHETLLLPVAQAGERLGLPGTSVAAVRRVLDKSCLKQTLRQTGTSVARDRVISSAADAWSFVDAVDFPLVLKPLNGSGGLATWCIRDQAHLRLALQLIQPGTDNPMLAEDYVNGQELCIDTVTLADEPRFHSICCYHPPILEALENPSIQWRCIMPRDINASRYSEFIEQGLAAIRALSVGNAVTHIEGFLLEDGGVRFTDATLRPAGARIGPMLAFAYDIDAHLMWARLMVDGCFDGPWERKYAVGTIFLRGTGHGHIERVEGLQTLKDQFDNLIVDGRLPQFGAVKSSTYTGDGFITVRHPETQVVNETLDAIADTVSITYSREDPAPKDLDEMNNIANNEALRKEWAHRLDYFDRQLNRPVWDEHSLESFDSLRPSMETSSLRHKTT